MTYSAQFKVQEVKTVKGEIVVVAVATVADQSLSQNTEEAYSMTLTVHLATDRTTLAVGDIITGNGHFVACADEPARVEYDPGQFTEQRVMEGYTPTPAELMEDQPDTPGTYTPPASWQDTTEAVDPPQFTDEPGADGKLAQVASELGTQTDGNTLDETDPALQGDDGNDGWSAAGEGFDVPGIEVGGSPGMLDANPTKGKSAKKGDANRPGSVGQEGEVLYPEPNTPAKADRPTPNN